ncbi:hypothetical protein D3Z60_27410 [Lachnospiraceae bacterium]|nr:hypothetical protein [Lachnospiraceae bacterium]
MTALLFGAYIKTVKGGKQVAKPKQNTERINIFLPPDLLESLKDEANKKGTNVSSLIRMILIEREENKK